MSVERRDNISWHAIRENWPVLLTIIGGLAFAFRGEALLQQTQARVVVLENIINIDEVVEHAVWQNNIKRDIEVLQSKKCYTQ